MRDTPTIAQNDALSICRSPERARRRSFPTVPRENPIISLRRHGDAHARAREPLCAAVRLRQRSRLRGSLRRKRDGIDLCFGSLCNPLRPESPRSAVAAPHSPAGLGWMYRRELRCRALSPPGRRRGSEPISTTCNHYLSPLSPLRGRRADEGRGGSLRERFVETRCRQLSRPGGSGRDGLTPPIHRDMKEIAPAVVEAWSSAERDGMWRRDLRTVRGVRWRSERRGAKVSGRVSRAPGAEALLDRPAG